MNRCARVSGGLVAVFETARYLSETLEIPEALDSCDLDRDALSDAVFRGRLGEPIRGGGGGLGGGLIVGVYIPGGGFTSTLICGRFCFATSSCFHLRLLICLLEPQCVSKFR